MTPSLIAAGADVKADPYGLLDSEGESVAMPYSDDVYAAMYSED